MVRSLSAGDWTRNIPVAVPDKIFGLTLILDFIDRCHSLTSLYPPQAALGSLPTGHLHLDGFGSAPITNKKEEAYASSFLLVPVTGLEPVRHRWRRILSAEVFRESGSIQRH